MRGVGAGDLDGLSGPLTISSTPYPASDIPAPTSAIGGNPDLSPPWSAQPVLIHNRHYTNETGGPEGPGHKITALD